jgi:hypothetical protein
MSEFDCGVDRRLSWWESFMYDVRKFKFRRWWARLWCDHEWRGESVSTYSSGFSMFASNDRRKWYRQLFYCSKCGKSRLKEWTNF